MIQANHYHDGDVDYLVAEWMKTFIESAARLAVMSCEDTEFLLKRYGILSKTGLIQEANEVTDLCICQRYHFVKHVSWAIPCREAIEAIVVSCWRESPPADIIDVCAGTGFWAALLHSVGIDVVAYDLTPPISRKFDFPRARVNEMDGAVALTLFPQRDVFMSWPPYNESLAERIALLMSQGRRLYYIGECEGGCTGTDKFFDVLSEDFEEIQDVCIPQFEGLHDRLFIFEKKKGG